MPNPIRDDALKRIKTKIKNAPPADIPFVFGRMSFEALIKRKKSLERRSNDVGAPKERLMKLNAAFASKNQERIAEAKTEMRQAVSIRQSRQVVVDPKDEDEYKAVNNIIDWLVEDVLLSRNLVFPFVLLCKIYGYGQ